MWLQVTFCMFFFLKFKKKNEKCYLRHFLLNLKIVLFHYYFLIKNNIRNSWPVISIKNIYSCIVIFNLRILDTPYLINLKWLVFLYSNIIMLYFFNGIKSTHFTFWLILHISMNVQINNVFQLNLFIFYYLLWFYASLEWFL